MILSRRLAGLIFTAFLLITLIPHAIAAGASETWLGIYMGDKKMGYMHLSTERVTFENRECIKIQSFVRTKIVLLGANVQQDINTVIYADDKLTPIVETMDMISGGRKTSIEARFGQKEVECKVKSGDRTTDSKVTIPAGASLVGDPLYALGTDKLKPGLKAKMYYFNPLKLAIEPIDIDVQKEEEIEVKGQKYKTLVVKNVTPMGDLTNWQTDAGQLIKVQGLMGITMLREPAEEAISGVDSGYTPPADLAAITSVKSNIDLPKPQSIKAMVIRLTGKIDTKLGIEDGRQEVKWLEGKGETRTAEFSIDATVFNRKKSVTLPIKEDYLAHYLKSTSYLECDAPEIKAQATAVAGKEKSAYAAACKLRKWVTKNMHAQADIGITRPAVDVLKTKVGVCRDYAVLYASLARAAGIPTKVVAGIVYVDGYFYYHAWAESWVGEWVPFDATVDSDFVDATHIKLAEGDATDMFQMAKVFGNLKAEITAYE